MKEGAGKGQRGRALINKILYLEDLEFFLEDYERMSRILRNLYTAVSPLFTDEVIKLKLGIQEDLMLGEQDKSTPDDASEKL